MANGYLMKIENEVNNRRTENYNLKAELSEMSSIVERESSNTKKWVEEVGLNKKSIEPLNLQVATLQGQTTIMILFLKFSLYKIRIIYTLPLFRQ